MVNKHLPPFLKPRSQEKTFDHPERRSKPRSNSPSSSESQEGKLTIGESFSRRMFPSRVLIYALCTIAFTGMYIGGDIHWLQWATTCLIGLGWPHIVYFYYTRTQQNGYHAERRVFGMDAFLCGLSLAWVEFHILPSIGLTNTIVTAFVMLCGLRGLIWFLLSCIAGMGVGVLLHGFHVNQTLSLWGLLASLPLIVVSPIVLGLNTFQLGLKLSQQKQEFQRLSRTDHLSQLWNRRHWITTLDHALERFHRYNTSATIAILDIDFFKDINDQYGHLAGDKAISTIGHIINGSIRKVDTACRYGGEEFALLMPDTNESQALTVAERLRASVAKRTMEAPVINSSEKEPSNGISHFSMTVSIGVSAVNGDFTSVNDWIKAADSALYQSKSSGRNQVTLWQPKPSSKQRTKNYYPLSHNTDDLTHPSTSANPPS
ncbi:GGDEF domain-containing protein [Marinibactrum halimedae]|uniref:diguanylate cyclase n=1 Tax=Marinibactrum halimedae TaxID=1444977 RepID=A0AA37T313_9GAMM|nr:GGDEF domain-containing protein [Marinibactrum halimedae]MCD9459324.1 diguanylate cyclase AdrA [Marinibactrum halimedae]GLS25785.1 hypothetical protein GCM10007877_14990 [Marinibactrum halimedae]